MSDVFIESVWGFILLWCSINQQLQFVWHLNLYNTLQQTVSGQGGCDPFMAWKHETSMCVGDEHPDRVLNSFVTMLRPITAVTIGTTTMSLSVLSAQLVYAVSVMAVYTSVRFRRFCYWWYPGCRRLRGRHCQPACMGWGVHQGWLACINQGLGCVHIQGCCLGFGADQQNTGAEELVAHCVFTLEHACSSVCCRPFLARRLGSSSRSHRRQLLQDSFFSGYSKPPQAAM